MNRTAIACSSIAAFAVIAAAIALGPLNPPTGAVSSTYKTLAEIEPRIAINATNTAPPASSTGTQFFIDRSGSYYLTGNITGESGKSCITVLAADVTIDLNGFQLIGVPGSQSAVNCVNVTAVPHLTIVNGTIRDWGENAVRASFSTTVCRLDGLHISGILSQGLATGPGSTITNCTVTSCGTGMLVGAGSTISNCTVRSNTSTGISAGAQSSLSNCSVSGNGAVGITAGAACTLSNCSALSNAGSTGMDIGPGSSITNCVARTNTNIGFTVGSQSTITNSTATGNGSIGISLGVSCTVESCTLSNNSVGIFSTRNGTVLNSTVNFSTSGAGVTTPNEGLRIEGCTISANATFGVLSDTFSNTSDASIVNCTIRDNNSGGISSEANTQVIACTVNGNGTTVASPGIKVTDGSSVLDSSANNNSAGGILAGAGATISRCNAYQNTGNGISVGGSSTVLDSTARLNTLDGILFSFRCQVRGNNSGSNTLAQFHATDTDNRIEANTAVSGARGFDIDAAGNIIFRNSSTGAATDWDIVANNTYGPIIDRRIPAPIASTPAVAGTAAASTLGSTDPNANFTY